jgi:hypothetical protein
VRNVAVGRALRLAAELILSALDVLDVLDFVFVVLELLAALF